MRRARAPRLDDGMTLVEMLVGLLLIGIVLSGMVAAILGGLASVQRANGQVAANQLANEVLESLRTSEFTAVSPVAPATTLTTTRPAQVIGAVTYNSTWTSTWVDSPCNNATASPNDYLSLQVVVTWQVSGTAKSLTVGTFRSPTPRDGSAFVPVRTTALTC